MKALWFVPLVAATLTTSVSAQEITLKDLVGTTITSTVWRAQVQRSAGKEYSGTVKSDVEIIVGNWGDPVQFTQTGTWFGSNGRTSTWTARGSGFPGKPGAIPGSGGGDGVGFLQNGTIYVIRTFKAGGFKFEFKLSRRSKGLTCTSRETYLRERGTHAIRLNSNVSGRPLVIVSDKLISSTCQVTKR
jgi:hypothetical protein